MRNENPMSSVIDGLYRSAQEGLVALAMIASSSSKTTFQEAMGTVTMFATALLGDSIDDILADFDFERSEKGR